MWAECMLSSVPSAAGLVGVILLGVGDTVASVVGKSIGRLKWSQSNKTIEGTVAFVLASSFAYRFLYLAVSNIRRPISSLAVDVVVLASGIPPFLPIFDMKHA